MRARAAALLLVAAAAGTARAEGRIGFSGGLRRDNGRLADTHDFGYLFGIESGYHPRGWGALGLSWSVRWTWFDPTDPGDPSGWLLLTDMTLGARLRQQISPDGGYVVLDLGLDVLRASDAIPPDDEQTYLGPALAVGLAKDLPSDLYVSGVATYALLFGGPSSLSLLFSIGVGSR